MQPRPKFKKQKNNGSSGDVELNLFILHKYLTNCTVLSIVELIFVEIIWFIRDYKDADNDDHSQNEQNKREDDPKGFFHRSFPPLEM